jgi:uncharacterized protein
VKFPVSGVQTNPLVPFLVALVTSTFTSTAGVSGAFLLMPFQVSYLGFAGPGVTPTNHLYNVIAIPIGVYRYIREGRMIWPITSIIVVGTIPGVVFGSLARIYLLPDAHTFKLFMGCVLLYIGVRMVQKVLSPRGKKAASPGGALRVTMRRFDAGGLVYSYRGEEYSISPATLFGLSAFIGIVGGAYGVGGGAIIAPILVSMYGLPVHTIAGATLTGTCLTSIVGVFFFAALGWGTGRTDLRPDYPLGSLLGVGGLLGHYVGTRIQKYLPARAIEIVLALVVTGTALRYVVGYFL